MREPSATLEAWFQEAKAAPSDINEHLDTLREYASRVEHVTEMGVRAGVSTVALLAAQPERLISWDIEPAAIINNHIAGLVNERGRTRFEPRVGNTLEITIEPTDLLFIDTLHTGAQLKQELIRHADPMANTVRAYLVFHDTATFGYRDEVGEGPGLRAAIRWFQRCHAFPVWQLIEDRQNNNGLVVLKNMRWRGA